MVESLGCAVAVATRDWNPCFATCLGFASAGRELVMDQLHEVVVSVLVTSSGFGEPRPMNVDDGGLCPFVLALHVADESR